MKKQKQKLPKIPSTLERKFSLYWKACGGPELEAEHKFCTDRKWRFDFAHPVTRVAIECEGGVFSGGRHTRPLGFIADCEKYNEAAHLGWLVFRLTSGQINMLEVTRIVQVIKRLNAIKGQ